MNHFITILAWVFLVLSFLRIVQILFFIPRSQQWLIEVLERTGRNPVGDAVRWPIINLIVCLCWLLSRL